MIVDQLNETRLAAYLGSHVEGFRGPVKAEKFAGGQSNPTFLLHADSGKYVLRKKPPGQLLQSAHAVDREYRVLKALEHTAVPVARAYHLCEDDAVVGSMFYVMSYEEGRIFWDPALPELSSAERGPIFKETVRVLATLHNVDVTAVGLKDYGRPGGYFERQIGRWVKQYRAAETETLDAMEALIHWLRGNTPQDDGQVSLIHGDYRMDNLIFHPTEPRICAVLDWELSTLGHPLADIAYLCMCLRLPDTGQVGGLGGKNLDALQLPDEKSIIEMYCQLRGINSIENWTFYLAFSFFRFAAITQGVFARALAGNASNKQALQAGNHVGLLAEMALAVIENEGLEK